MHCTSFTSHLTAENTERHRLTRHRGRAVVGGVGKLVTSLFFSHPPTHTGALYLSTAAKPGACEVLPCAGEHLERGQGCAEHCQAFVHTYVPACLTAAAVPSAASASATRASWPRHRRRSAGAAQAAGPMARCSSVESDAARREALLSVPMACRPRHVRASVPHGRCFAFGGFNKCDEGLMATSPPEHWRCAARGAALLERRE